jgi:hypothetical protein
MVHDISLVIPVNDHMFGCWDKAMLDPPVSADGILVCSCMKESEVKGFLLRGIITGKQYLLV